MGTARKGMVTRSIEVFPGAAGADRIKFHGEGTLEHIDIQRYVGSLGTVNTLNTESGIATVKPPLDEQGLQLLVDFVDVAFPVDLVMVNDRRGDLPYANPPIYPSHCQ